MTEGSEDRLRLLEELAPLAAQMLGEQGSALVTARWQRLLLGRLTELLLNEDSRLTGAELRQLLGMGPEADRPKTALAGAKLPAQFGEIVRQIYGVNLQTDIQPDIQSAEDSGQAGARAAHQMEAGRTRTGAVTDIRENPNATR